MWNLTDTLERTNEWIHFVIVPSLQVVRLLDDFCVAQCIDLYLQRDTFVHKAAARLEMLYFLFINDSTRRSNRESYWSSQLLSHIVFVIHGSFGLNPSHAFVPLLRDALTSRLCGLSFLICDDVSLFVLTTQNHIHLILCILILSSYFDISWITWSPIPSSTTTNVFVTFIARFNCVCFCTFCVSENLLHFEKTTINADDHSTASVQGSSHRSIHWISITRKSSKTSWFRSLN